MGLLVVGLVLGLLSLALVMVLANEIRFRREGLNDAVLELRARMEGLHQWVDQAEAHLAIPERELLRQAKQYVDWHFEMWMTSKPVETLRRYGAERVRWSALKAFGIRSLMDFAEAQETLQSVPGIGAEGFSRLHTGAREFARSAIPSWRPPIPAPWDQESVDTWVVMSALQLHRLRQCAALPFDELKATVKEVEREASKVAGPIRTRLRLLMPPSAHGEAMKHRIARLKGQLYELMKTTVPEFEQLVSSCVVGSWDDDCLREYQENFSSIIELIEEFTALAFERDPGYQGAPPTFGERAWPLHLRHGHVSQTLTETKDERTLCDAVIDSLIRRMGYVPLREVAHEIPVGSAKSKVFIDFCIRNAVGDTVALLEAKARIQSDVDLARARDQVVSFAVWQEVNVLLVAAAEGMWLYERDGVRCELVRHWSLEEAWNSPSDVRTTLEQVREGGPHGE